MIEVKLSGGLGNQLFQYAYAKKLQKHTMRDGAPEPIFLNGTWIRLRDPLRDPELHNFVLNDTAHVVSTVCGGRGHNLLYFPRFLRVFWRLVLKPKWCGKRAGRTVEDFERESAKGIISEYRPYCCRLPKSPLPPFKYCSGFFQSYETVAGMEEELRRDLTIKDEVRISPVNAEMLAAMKKTESVCVHIRRGDYLKPENDIYNVCTEAYYRRAVQAAKQHFPGAVFYVFSGCREDIEYIRRNYDLGESVCYVDLSNGTIEDFRLMMSCKHFIISNSTYSWWAAILGSYAGKMVWAPRRWRKDQPQAANELYAPEWQRIEV